LVALIDELSPFEVVGLAKTGAEAIDGVAELKPAVLVLDMAMPGGNGLDVLQTVKQSQSAPLVIVLTNYPVYRQRCLEAGADYFFDKSTEFEQLHMLLERLEPDAGTRS
jgi:DNA-binding NarL/FixJ family response regulator